MSTLKVAAINNPSAGSGGLAISTSGNVTGAGMDLVLSQTFTAASAVSVNNCFSAAYDNYRLVIRANSAIGNNQTLRMRAAGVDETGANYDFQSLTANATTLAGAKSTAQTSATFAYFSTGTTASVVDLISPYLAAATVGTSMNPMLGSVGSMQWTFSHSLATSYDGFTISVTGATITGVLRVYGYKN